jgi:acetyl-CoA acetyltransferase
VSDAYIYDGPSTPCGRYDGRLASVRPDDLLAGVIRALLARNPSAAGHIEDAIIDCANQAGEDNRNGVRHGSLLAGLDPSVAD